MDYQLHHRILVWLEIAAENLRQSLSKDLEVNQKTGANDLVTEMDKATERFFVTKIREHYPEHRVIGEEGIGEPVTDTKGMIWVIDPIDGTLNFVKQKNNFGIMIGLFEDGKPVAGYIYDVMKRDLYYGIVGDGAYHNGHKMSLAPIMSLSDSLAIGNVVMFATNVNQCQRLMRAVLGVRAHGSAALEMIEVLRGQASVYLSFGLRPWDYAAGYAIGVALGLKVSQPDGSPLSILRKEPFIFCHPNVYEEVMDVLKENELGELDE
ncbi:inositol monophosphatase family protein [Aerococcaceae bacterium NML191292]|nr:inositol monophosphatase family protein [Aerococcaceae bacterium NML210727]MCW6654632.1 inositol monophosphatase family protein [Aerococcaceae bacterium NML201296]MCW6658879.1 inositol monophosphatase family protein [Aerococcaceae bacterium NML191292]MCW6663344.1 inositol monophosphatase family protein [Aerococcaceae bacterium NML190073]MCW6666646.1 inositol monophosphatase family protein [Aerococcaceae bacterium NML190938]MCW6682393.1 inositol monophosphatase family protein [Aerococcaceae 